MNSTTTVFMKQEADHIELIAAESQGQAAIALDITVYQLRQDWVITRNRKLTHKAREVEGTIVSIPIPAQFVVASEAKPEGIDPHRLNLFIEAARAFVEIIKNQEGKNVRAATAILDNLEVVFKDELEADNDTPSDGN